MKTDFVDAHKRHWEDAEILFKKERWANADHLYGFSAECGLKALMRKFGMPWDRARGSPSQQKDRQHIDKIWDRYSSYQSGHVNGPGFATSTNNPFANWGASDRYANQSNFSQALVNSHQTGANEVRELIKKAQRDGLL
jgi:hypothetical protein